MKTFLAITGALLVLICAGVPYLLFHANVVSGSWRYRLTVQIQTPDGLKTGSAVREVSASAGGLVRFRDGGGGVDVKGEAVVVDLGARGVVFALIHDGSYQEFYKAFPYNSGYGGEATIEGIRYYNTLETGLKAPLPPDQYPRMVMFKDLNDPKSVTLVKGGRFDPQTQTHIPVDDFETLFGPGVSLKTISVEITEDPVTWSVEKWLPWLPDRYRGNLDGTLASSSSELSNTLHYGNFKTGGKR